MMRTKCVTKPGAALLCALLAASITQAAQAGTYVAFNNPTQTATNEASAAVGPNAQPGNANPPVQTAYGQSYQFEWIPLNGDIFADPAPPALITWTYAYGATFTTSAGPNGWAQAVASFGGYERFGETRTETSVTTDPITGTPKTTEIYLPAPVLDLMMLIL